jgi:hypothetical protein
MGDGHNTENYQAQGGALWVVGPSGALRVEGELQDAAGLAQNVVHGTVAGLAVAVGSVLASPAEAAVVTGLSAVTAFFPTPRAGDATEAAILARGQEQASTPGTVDVTRWEPAGASTPGVVPATVGGVVDWVAFGDR